MKTLVLSALLASAALGLALAYGLSGPDDEAAVSAAVAVGTAATAPTSPTSTDAPASYAARRLAFAPPGAVEAQALIESTPPTLIGLSRGARTVAFLTLQGQSARLAVGESLQGWRVLAITPHGVVVRRSGRPVRLDLYDRQAR